MKSEGNESKNKFTKIDLPSLKFLKKPKF